MPAEVPTDDFVIDVLSDFFVTEEERRQIAMSVREETLGGQAAAPVSLLELMAFWVANEEYAIDITDVQEIIKVPQITPVPRVPPFVLGIISLRGVVVPLIDLRRVLGFESLAPGRETRAVVLGGGGAPLGLVVDRTTRVIRVANSDVEPPPANLERRSAELIEGITRHGDRIIILLEGRAILDLLKLEPRS